MLKDLMLDDTLKSVLGEASKTSLKWNHLKVALSGCIIIIASKKTVDPKYNEEVVLEACATYFRFSLRP